MAGAISLRADQTTRVQITRLWAEVATLEDEPSMERLSYPPHITFAIYDRVDMARLEHTVRAAFADCMPLRVTFDLIKVFDTSPMVLWASPKDATPLVAIHAAIHGHLDPSTCHEHYRPGAWIPHCTLGTGIRNENREAALAFAARVRPPFDVVFDTADWISFPPVEVAGSLQLRADRDGPSSMGQ